MNSETQQKYEIEILRTKVDFHKTMLAVTLGAGLTCNIAYWQIDAPLGKNTVLIMSTLLLLSSLVLLMGYINRHKLLIRTLKSKSNE